MTRRLPYPLDGDCFVGMDVPLPGTWGSEDIAFWTATERYQPWKDVAALFKEIRNEDVSMTLLVISDFEDRKRGDVIFDAATIAAIQESAHAHCVVSIALDPPRDSPASAAPSIPVED